ncbi:hypothetical protein [Sphingomonas xinjiangensis]|uniref:Uncharacterized protein n=1 Tax=Sphingomonas xinjiangensis TaxID=643568 RepID=A0A840YJP1_9SPHN|nr:hypothetical protein [Sphingomonas xinjiangensis]MBB5709146.1 hypothetical protein [Sphingomonas xinjiangensis]
MKLTTQADTSSQPSTSTLLVLEAIVRLRCLSAEYNRTRMILAPHILYTRDDKLYVDGVVIVREGMIPREEKMGTFKLDGLKELNLLERAFAISALFDSTLDKYQGVTLMGVEPQAG